MNDSLLYKPSKWQTTYHTVPDVDELLGAGAAGPGKALPLDEPIPTPGGWSTMGRLRVGQMVFNEQGKPCRVVAKSPIWKQRDCARVVFDDGTSVVADLEHEWLTLDYNERQSLRRSEKCSSHRTGRNNQEHKRRRAQARTTEQIRRTLKHRDRVNHSVMVAGALDMPEESLPVDPYVFGAWLGDGDSHQAGLTCADQEILEEIQRRGLSVTPRSGKYHWYIKGINRQLRLLGVLNNKRIPLLYGRASREQRMEVLRGLVDTDGHIDRDGRVEVTLCNQQLAGDVFELVVGLGFKATIAESDATLEGRVVGRRWRICWSPMGRDVARLPRKVARIGKGQRTQRWRYIVAVEPAGRRDTQCIQVDSGSHLFLAGRSMVPTHNSLCLLMDPMQQVLVEHARCEQRDHQHPLRWGQSKGWALHLRREGITLQQTIARAMTYFKAVDPNVRWQSHSNAAGIFHFASGFKYEFNHCKDPFDYEKYMSNEYSHIAFDEANQFEEEQYDQIITRLRSSDPVLRKMLKVRLMSNPTMRMEDNTNITVKDPFWLRKRFVDPCPEGNKRITRKLRMQDGKIRKHTRMYLPATLFDNPDEDFVREYEFKLRSSAKPHIVHALLYGNWYATPGAFFGDDWNPQLHVCKPFRIPRDWPVFRSMDWGFKKPGTIGWFALDPDDTLYCFRELTFQGKDAKEVAGMVKEFEKSKDVDLWGPNGSRITGPADTQLWEERGDVGKSKAQEFAEAGISWVSADKGKGNRQRNAERLLARLKDHGDGATRPGIVFFETCKHSIKTIPSIPTSKTNMEEPMDGGDDHWLDMVMYACAHASRGRDAISMQDEDDDDSDDDEQERGSRGRCGYGSAVC